MNTKDPEHIPALVTTRGEIFRYGFGGATINVVYMTYMSYIIFYWTDYAMISAAAAGAIYFIGRLVMAFSDPIAGLVIDRTMTRYGRFRPFLMITTPVVAVLFFLLFTDFDLGTTAKIVIYAVMFIVFAVFAATQTVAYEAQVPSMSSDLSKRNFVVMSRQLIGTTLAIAAMASAIPLVEAFGGGHKGWHGATAVFAIASCVFMVISLTGSKRHDTPQTGKAYEKTEGKHILHDLKSIVSIKAVILLVCTFGFVIMATEIVSATNMYIFKYAVGNEGLFATVTFASLPANLLAAFVTPFLVGRFGKKKIFLIAAVCAMIRPLAYLVLKPFDMVPVIILLAIIAQFCMIVMIVDIWSMVADCVEYVKRAKQLDSAGLVTSCNTFMLDFGGAIAGIVVGGLMTLFGYSGSETFETVSSSVLNGILFIHAGIPIIALVGAIIVNRFYPITNKILAELGANVGKQVAE